MERQPGGDSLAAAARVESNWATVLNHRSPDDAGFADLVARFTACGIEPGLVYETLRDGGDALYRAAASGEDGWADAFGGPLAVALLAAEVSHLAAQLNSRASGIRAAAVSELLDEFSAVTVARELGVARQKVYEIARNGLQPPYLEHVPWRES